MLKVFISATSHDLTSYRKLVTEWARTRGYEPVVQEDFPVMSDYGTIVQMLRDKLAPCDAVIHLAGAWYGAEPNNRPEGEQRRSYTQLEFELAKELRRQVFRFVAREDYTPDKPLTQSEEHRELQRKHCERLKRGNEPYSATSRTSGNEFYYSFSSSGELLQLLNAVEIRPTVAKPNNLPFGSLGTLFKGREEFLDQLRRVLMEKPTHVAAVTGKQAIHGLGGVGKTRTALEYAWKYQHEYTALLFVTADSASSLDQNLAGLCGPQVLNLPEREEKEIAVQVAAVRRWLKQNAGWLLIVDNVDTPEAATAVETLQQLTTGHLLITSRMTHWGSGVEALHLDVLETSAAADFLLERTDGKRRPTPTDAEEARLLAMDLDGLALALEQAGAFIAKHRVKLADYRKRWHEQEGKVIEWFDPLTMKYPRSVATTWQTSMDVLSDDGRRLLDILCWLAPDPIPRDMLDHLDGEFLSAPLDVETALADLTTYSLARWQDDGDGVLVHRLIEEITRYRLAKADQEHCLQAALDMVNRFFPSDSDDVRYWPACQSARAHAIILTGHAESIGNPMPTGRLLNQLGVYLNSRAEHRFAETLLRRALAIDEQNFGLEHPNVATCLNNLAALLEETNRLVEAEPLMRRALAIDEQSFGRDHPDVATDLNNLAQLLKATNRLVEAEPLMRQALAIDEQSFGRDHPNVARDLNNLAQLLKATNRLVEAEPLMRQALAIDEQSFGRDHPNVARDLNNLAQLLKATNRLVEAEPLMRQALAIDEQSFGHDHPRVARDLTNLAALLQATNRLVEAEPLMRRSLAIDEQSFGRDHPNVARDLTNLAALLQATNRLVEAEPLMRQALAIDEQSFGRDHPRVAIHLTNLAQLLQTTNRLVEAEPLMRRSLAIDEQSFGHDHPNVARDLNNLALLLQATNRLVEAEPLMRRSLAIDEQSFGRDHPNVARDLNNLAALLQATNRLVEAEPLMRRSLAIDEASFGPDHPHVAVRLNNLAQLLEEMNYLNEPETFFRRVLTFGLVKRTQVDTEPLRRRVLMIFCKFTRATGHRHPNLLDAVNSYWALLVQTGLPEAERHQRVLSTGFDPRWLND